MTTDLGNGVAIARLLGDGGTRVAGYLYFWGSGDVGIMWAGNDREIAFVDRVLDVDVLARARAVESAELVEFLETLPVKAS